MQRIILKQLKAEVLRFQGQISGELAQYFEAYAKEFKKSVGPVTKTKFIRDISKADIVFGGDFHAFTQSQRTHLRILREIIHTDRPIVLALEAVEIKNQTFIEAYLGGRISEKTFLKKIDFDNTWGFPWEQYKIFFEFAKSHKIPLYGLNFQSKNLDPCELTTRDGKAAEKLKEIQEGHPGALIYVLYGDLHVSKSKLPSLAKKILKAGSKQVTVFQNSEKLYWRLVAQKKEEKVDVIQLRKDAYCVFNSPPWLKWQAYLDFLEKKAGIEEQPDFADTIHKYCQSISGVLSLKEKFIDFHAFKTGDTHFASSLARFDISSREQKYMQKLIQSGASFYVPGLHLFYFQSTAVNKVVSLVGQYIHAKLNSNKKIMCSFPADFDEMIWRESIGFFFSKILNNRRKIRLPEPTPSHKVVTVLAMEYRLKQQLALSLGQDLEVLKAHPNRKTKHYLEASTLIGAILGQKIYDGFMSGRIEKGRLKSWLEHGFEKRNHFRRFYLNVLMYLSELKLKSTNPRDRL